MQNPKKILLMRLTDKVGDTIIASFFYREIRGMFPKAKITLMTCGHKEIIKNIPYFDEVIFVPATKSGRIFFSLLQLPKLVFRRYDLLVSFTTHWRMKLFNFCIHAKQTKIVPCVDGHLSLSYERILSELMPNRKINTKYELNIPSISKENVLKWLNEHHVKDDFLIINPVASCKEYTLSQRKLDDIVNKIRLNNKCSIVILDYNRQYKTSCMHYSSNVITEVAFLISKSSYVLTVDTGISHLAEVYNRPMTVLFSGSPKPPLKKDGLKHIANWKPRGENVTVLFSNNTVNEIPTDKMILTMKNIYE